MLEKKVIHDCTLPEVEDVTPEGAALVASVHVFQGGACDHKASVCWGECRHEDEAGEPRG